MYSYQTTSAGTAPGAKLAAGDVIVPRTLTSIAGEPIGIPDGCRRIHLQLRRFAGCPVCNVHLGTFVRKHTEMQAAGVRVVAVFHSKKAELIEHVDDVPFDLVADPEKALYRELGAEAGARALADPRGWPKIARSITRASGALFRGRPLPPLDPGGGRWGLPAEFLIDTDGRVLASKYGEHVDDAWSADEVLARATKQQ